MARFSKGRRALSISDRSGAAFPYNEMVEEWTGAWVHNSEFEVKQPQLEPHPVGADPQALQHARPARVEFPVQDILPNNPFTTTVSTTVTVTQPSHNFSSGDAVRFRDVQQAVGGVAISTLELETTLNGDITAAVTSLALTDASAFPSSGYLYVQTKPTPAQTRAGENTFTLSEVIKYTGKSTNTLTGLTRGSSAPTYGLTPQASTATAHSDLDKVFGSYSITPINITVNYPGQPSTKTISNQYTFVLASAASSATTAGGFPSFAGPVGDRP